MWSVRKPCTATSCTAISPRNRAPSDLRAATERLPVAWRGGRRSSDDWLELVSQVRLLLRPCRLPLLLLPAEFRLSRFSCGKTRLKKESRAPPGTFPASSSPALSVTTAQKKISLPKLTLDPGDGFVNLLVFFEPEEVGSPLLPQRLRPPAWRKRPVSVHALGC